MMSDRPARSAGTGTGTGAGPVLVVVDVDGVTSPVNGSTPWTDDVEVGNVFGPVVVSPALVAHLDALADVPGVTCVWMTDWSPTMRAAMSLFPGRDWPQVRRADRPGRSRSWWKLAALQAWLHDISITIPADEFYTAVVWLDDDLRAPARQAACRRRLEYLGLDSLLIAPRTNVGVTPAEMLRVGDWIKTRVATAERFLLDEAWRTSPVAPCGCPWDGWHCPHCGSVTASTGDAWHPAHTLCCHSGVPASSGTGSG